MTSPDFMYPQPTDDELAAQQPRTVALGGHATGIAGNTPSGTDFGDPAAGANRPRLGKVAMVTAIVGAGMSLIASIILAVTIGPMEVSYGYYFTDIPSWYRNLALALFGLQALCAVLGVTGLIMGIVSVVTGRGRTQGIVAIAVALLAPFVSFGLFLVLSLTFG